MQSALRICEEGITDAHQLMAAVAEGWSQQHHSQHDTPR